MKIRHKYNAKPVDIDGFRFPSKKEGEYYRQLKLAQGSGSLLFFLRQCPIFLPGGVKMVIDFIEFWADGRVEFVDVKGKKLQSYIDKKKMVEALYPVTIVEK